MDRAGAATGVAGRGAGPGRYGRWAPARGLWTHPVGRGRERHATGPSAAAARDGPAEPTAAHLHLCLSAAGLARGVESGRPAPTPDRPAPGRPPLRRSRHGTPVLRAASAFFSEPDPERNACRWGAGDGPYRAASLRSAAAADGAALPHRGRRTAEH